MIGPQDNTYIQEYEAEQAQIILDETEQEALERIEMGVIYPTLKLEQLDIE